MKTLVFLAFAWVLAAPPAAAQMRCAGLADVLAMLAQRWDETALWSGTRDDGRSLTITVAPDGGSWTALLVDGNGLACLVASGTGWSVPALPLPGEEG